MANIKFSREEAYLLYDLVSYAEAEVATNSPHSQYARCSASEKEEIINLLKDLQHRFFKASL